MTSKRMTAPLVLTLVLLSTMFVAAKGAPAPTPARARAQAEIARGKYLVTAMACNDCHTPWTMGPNGPEPDMSRMLSGHPAELKMPPAPAVPGPWGMVAAATNTAYAGPWGVSFTANLTPDADTGLGGWTEVMFKQAMRTGKHEGKGRPIMPPMPWPGVGSLSDADLHALFAYLHSIPAVRNKVPAPLDPAEPATRQ